MKTPELTESEFKEWLSSNPELVFSSDCNSTNCPLAQYLLNITGTHWYVTVYRYSKYEGTGTMLPEWAQEFINRFDLYRFETENPISSAMALSFLEKN